jgi:TP901 family phage tail tape measure protein
VRTVSVRLLADIGGYTSNMRKAATETKTLRSEIDKAAQGGRLDEVTNAATGLGLGLVGVAAVAVKFAMDFEKQMSNVKAAAKGAGASAAQVEALGKASLQAGKDTAFSATEAAKGVEELIKAGVSASDVLGGGLKGALDLAAAGELSVAEAAETSASALTQFKLKGRDVPHVADLLSAAAGKAQGSVHDMGQALNQVALIAAGTGLSIEDTTGTLAAFASAGLIGSDAGTSFKTMLQAIQAPSGKTKELMDDLGVSAYDAGGNFIGIANFAQNLKDKLAKLTPEVRANAFAQIFGSDATRAATILYEQGAVGIQEWVAKTNDAGYAAETAAIKTDNLAGDIERLKGSLETAAIEAGGGMTTGLRVLTKAADGLVGAVSDLPPGLTAAMTVMTALGGVLVLGSVAWLKTRVQMAAVVAELNAMGPAGARAAVGLQAATKWAGRATVAFLALEGAQMVFDALGNSAIKVDKLTASLQDYADTGKMSGELTSGFGKDLEDFGLIAGSADAATHGLGKAVNDLVSLVPGVKGFVDTFNEGTWGTSFNDATDRMAALDDSFSAFIATQKDAKVAGDLWNKMLLKSGLETEQLAALLPATWAGLGELQKAAHSGAGATERLTDSTAKATEALEKEAEAAKTLEKAFDDLFDRYMSADQAAMEYEKTLTSTAKELKDGARKLDIYSEAGQKNRAATLDLIKAIKDQREANINNGMSVSEADEKYRKQIGTLAATMIKLKFTKKDVEALIGKYRDIPGKVGTTIETPGMAAADKRVREYDKKLKDLARRINTELKVTGDGPANAKLKALLIQQRALQSGLSLTAAGAALNKDADRNRQKNYWSGGRTPRIGEREPAGVVHGGEVVLNARTVRRVDKQSPGFLDEMHATGQLPGFYAGGRVVTARFPVDASKTKVMSLAEALAVVGPSFSRDWPSSPGAQRGDSGVWRDVVKLIKSGPKSGSFGNAYRDGDPKWHGSGRAVDWMGYEQDELASYLASKRPLELIHRTNKRDYAYTRGHNKGSFNSALMNAHKNHIHIAMANGGTIMEPVFGIGQSGASYSFGEGGKHERVTPISGGGGGGGGVTYVINLPNTPLAHPREIGRQVVGAIQAYERGSGASWRTP